MEGRTKHVRKKLNLMSFINLNQVVTKIALSRAAKSQYVTTAEKIMFIHQKVNKIKFGTEWEEYGVDEMIRRRVIKTAYPLHDIDGQPEKSEPLS